MRRPGFLRLHLPTGREIARFGVLSLIVLAAIASTQLLPIASAQDSADAKSGADANETADRSAAVATDQASSPDRSLAVQPISTGSSDSAGLTSGFQLSSPSGNPAPPRQLSTAGQDAGQLGAQKLEGQDVCDDALPGSGPDICARPIETRAGEFSGRQKPQLSAEQRLLAQQYSGTAGGDATDATARRLGAGRTADLSNDDLAIAAVVTAAQTAQNPPAEEEASDIPADATNAIDAILGAITNAPQPR